VSGLTGIDFLTEEHGVAAPVFLKRNYIDAGEGFGLLADGTGAALSTKYASLAAAQVDYPFAAALTQTIDYCALKQASNQAFGADSSENYSSTYSNKPLYLPAGRISLGSDTWKITKLKCGKIIGSGKIATQISGNGTIFQTDGLWYCNISCINFISSPSDWEANHVYATGATITTFVASLRYRTFKATVGGTSGSSAPSWPTDGTSTVSDGTVTWQETFFSCVDIDGNVAQDGSTNGVQGCTFQDLLIDAGHLPYGLSMCRVGQGSGQGSENIFLNCHWANGGWANYYQNGFNVIANQIIGGDMQGYLNHGAYTTSGNLTVRGTSFETGHILEQIENGAFDIYCDSSGVAGMPVIVEGCRTEGMAFFHNGSVNVAKIRNVCSNPAASVWKATQAYALNDIVYTAANASTCGRPGQLFKVTTAGISGSSTPSWSTDGTTTVSDGTVVWAEVVFDYIYNLTGDIDFYTSAIRKAGRLRGYDSGRGITTSVTANYTVQDERTLLVDASGGAVTITMNPDFTFSSTIAFTQKYLTVIQTDASANTVTLAAVGSADFYPGAVTTKATAGNGQSSLNVAYAIRGGTSERCWIVL